VKGNPVLGKLATESIKKWKFTPFTASGKAIKVTSQFIILFTGEA
jgi:outer membrane biosynthesis protein TonB